MAEVAALSSEIVCPGCHFGCKLAKYQCGRGKEFFDIAAASGELPERRGPMMTPSEKAARPDGKPPVNDRVMHGLNIVANRLRERHEQADIRAAVLGTARAGASITPGILAKRLNLATAELAPIVENAKTEGLVVLEDDDRGIRMVRLTESGAEQARVWKTERDLRNAEFLSALSDEEKETLALLLRKTLGLPVNMKQRQKGPQTE